MIKAIVVVSDDWEGLYINGELKEEGHTLEEGGERVLYFLHLQNEYKFNINEIEFMYCSNKDIERVEEKGSFPVDISGFHKLIKIRGNKL